MPTGFNQQQQPLQNRGFLKSAPTPQHGQSADQALPKPPEPRSFQPRPGH